MGSTRLLLTDPSGIPLAISLTGDNRNDVTNCCPSSTGVGPVRGKPGRPPTGAEQLIADRGYDHDKYRRALSARGVKPVIARRQTEHGSGLSKLLWVVERTFAWLHFFHRLRLRWNAAPRSTKPSCTSPAPSSVSVPPRAQDIRAAKMGS